MNSYDLRLITLSLLIFFGSFQSANEANVFSDEARFTSKRLDNGLQVSVYEDQRMPIVTVQLAYYIGSSHEEDDSRGLAHLFEHLMFSATEKYPERAVFNLVEQHGGSTNATTSFDETRYFALVPPGPHIGVLEIYADRMVNLLVTEEDLDRDKKIVLEELRVNAQNDPINRIGFEALRQGFGDHPYAISPLGTEDDVNRATVAGCIEFYQRYYGPQNAHLSIVGPVGIEETLQLAERLFGSIEKQVETPRAVPSLASWDFPEELNLSDDIPPVEASALVFELPTASSEDYEAIRLMILLISGLDGFEDELIRKRRRALYAQMLDLPTKAGRVLAFASISLPYRRKATAFLHLDQTLETLARFEWLDEQSLRAAKRRYLQTEYRGRYRSSTMASRIEFAHGWQSDVRRAFDREDRINAVSLEDVKRVYQRFVVNSEPTRIYIEPTRVPWYVSTFGWLYPLADRMGLTRFFL